MQLSQRCGEGTSCSIPTGARTQRRQPCQEAPHAEVPTSEMLSICQTHSALDTGLTEMGLREKKVNAIQKTAGRRRQQPPKGQCGNCTKKHPSGRDNCPARDATCHGCGNKGHWKTKCRKSQKADKGQTSRRPQHPKKLKGRRTDEIDVDQDEITVA